MSNSRATQNRNLARLVMSTLHRLNDQDGVTATDITKFLRHQFGGVWRSTLKSKAEQTLKTCVEMGFLERQGNRYLTSPQANDFVVNLNLRHECGIGSSKKARSRAAPRPYRRQARARPRSRPPTRRRSVRRRRACPQGRIRKKRADVGSSRKKYLSDDEQSLQLVDDVDSSDSN